MPRVFQLFRYRHTNPPILEKTSRMKDARWKFLDMVGANVSRRKFALRSQSVFHYSCMNRVPHGCRRYRTWWCITRKTAPGIRGFMVFACVDFLTTMAREVRFYRWKLIPEVQRAESGNRDEWNSIVRELVGICIILSILFHFWTIVSLFLSLLTRTVLFYPTHIARELILTDQSIYIDQDLQRSRNVYFIWIYQWIVYLMIIILLVYLSFLYSW